MRDLSVREKFAALAPVIVLIVVLGFFPKPLIDAITPTVKDTMVRVGVTDPAPKILRSSTKAGVSAMPATFTVPPSEYGTLSPLLIILGAADRRARRGVPAPRVRYATQFALALLGIVAALVATILVAGTSKVAAEGAVAVDGVTLFLWVILLVLGWPPLLLVAERGVDGGSMAFASQAAALPGTVAERLATPAPGRADRGVPADDVRRSAGCCCSRPRTTC